MKTKQRYYYFAIDIVKNSTRISTSKQDIADYLGISARTVTRNLCSSLVYYSKEYIIGKSLGINKIKGRGKSF